jgi:SAM-dependent methyltransferase
MEAFFPRRPDGVAAILEVLGELLPPGPWRLLDLGAGTGSLARALLERFPRATVVALDLDPVLMAIGRGALGETDGRLTWLQVDLRTPDWPDRLGPVAPFDAVVSLATLHHFSSRELAAIYAALARVTRAGGLVLNAEGLAVGRPASRLARHFDELRRRGAPPADGWWEAIEADPALAGAVAERDRLRDRMRGAARKRSAEAHCRALRQAGFAEAAVAWRYLDEALVVGLR